MNNTFLKITFIFSFFFTMLIGYLNIIHVNNADSFLPIGVIISIICLVVAIYEVITSKKLNPSKKLMWIIAFLITGYFALIFYVLSKREDIISNPGTADRLRKI